MKKIFIILAFFLMLFFYTSVQAKMAMGITLGQEQSDEKSADADKEETKETGSVAYEALGLRAVELNPNDYQDEDVALPGPHKAMEIMSGQEQSDEKSAGADNEETKEAGAVDYGASGLRAVELNSNDYPDENVALPEAHKAMEIMSGQEESDEKSADVDNEETKETGSVDYEALGLRAVELNPNDYPDEVIALLEPHKDNENNDNVLFFSSLGLAYKNKGRLNDAIATYKRALELVPDVPAIQYNLGVAYFYNNELSKSFKYFLKSSEQRPDHPGTKEWIKHLVGVLNIYKVPDTSKLKLVVNRKISVDREKTDRESRLRIYLTEDGGRIQELSVNDKIYSYGIDSDTERPVDYIIIDNDGDGDFDKVINTKGKFGVPTWAYNPD